MTSFVPSYLLLISVALSAIACDVGGAEPNAATLVVEGQAGWAAGSFPEALELFEQARALDPQNAAALRGIARSNHALNLYAPALEAYEGFVAQVPEDPLGWEGFLGALVWGGILEGNGRRIERAIELAPTAIAAAPDNVELYAHLRTATAELDRLDDLEAILADLTVRYPNEPAIRIESAKARLEAARRRRNLAAAAGDAAEASGVIDLETTLRAELDALAAEALTDAAARPAIHYRLAVGYDLLGDVARSLVALGLLEATDAGRRMATPLRYREFLDEWVASSGDDTETRMLLAERWLPRFAPSWSGGISRHRAIEEMQFDVLLRDEQLAVVPGADTIPDATPDTVPADVLAREADRQRRLERLTTLGRRLARVDTWDGASRYVETARVLARHDDYLESAVRVAAEGIAALESDRPGLIYPGMSSVERQATRLRRLATLKQLQGQALHGLGRDGEAEAAVREAIALRPVAGSFAVLGGLLLGQGRDSEALDVLVAALAHGFRPGETALQAETYAAALAAAARSDTPAEVVDAAVAFAAERIAAEVDREIVAEPLDLVAPAFALADREGETWRLDDLRGNVVVLNYWATWCGPCAAEFPHYQTLVEEYATAGDVVFLAISTDSDPGVVGPWLDERGLDFTVLYDQGSAVDYQVSGIPASFLIDKDGRIRYRTSGFPGEDRYLREMRLRIEALRKNP